jgi:hypothetical protein
MLFPFDPLQDPFDAVEKFINETRTFLDGLPGEFVTIVDKVGTMSNSFELKVEQAGVELESIAASLSEELRDATLQYIVDSLSTTLIVFAAVLAFVFAVAVCLILWVIRRWLRAVRRRL